MLSCVFGFVQIIGTIVNRVKNLFFSLNFYIHAYNMDKYWRRKVYLYYILHSVYLVVWVALISREGKAKVYIQK